jgi:Fe-S cluster biogenesis protein NfuA
MIGIHAERVGGDDRAVRWVTTGAVLPVGRVTRAPGRLGDMLYEPTFSDALTERSAVWLWLREGLSWSTCGNEVRAALRDALDDPAGWVVEPAPGEVLEHVAADLLAGSIGEFIRSHGGAVRAQRYGDEVAVHLGGACEHCSAAEHTLRLRLLEALRGRCPDLVETGGGEGQLRLRIGNP